MSDTKTVAGILRKQFPPEQIGQLPRGNAKIDYVGHADVTSRLLEADPEWTWEPKSRDVDPSVLAAAVASGNPEVVRVVLESAPPKFDLDARGAPVGLWISLTIGGVTRPGYGSCPSSQSDAVKVLIGDALRNAAMRFGVALDLWAKGDRADPTAENATASAGQADRRPARQQRSAGDAWDGAQPSRPAQPHARPAASSPPNGHTARPAAQSQPVPAGERDPDAQVFADDAAMARTLDALKAVRDRAMQAKKTSATVANPSTGALGVLGVFIEWKRKQLAQVDTALRALERAAGVMPAPDLDAHVRQVTGASVEDATAAQLKKAADALAGRAA